MPRRAKHTQKQKQAQSVKQSVIIHLDKTHKRKRSYRRKVSREGREGQGQPQYISSPQLPPNVIYQSHQIQNIPFPTEVKVPITAPEPAPNRLIDVGQIGTEGAVKILELPTKKETLAELTTPVSVSIPIKKAEEIPAEKQKQKQEQQQMGREDIASINLGLSKFNYNPPQDIASQVEQPSVSLKGRETAYPEIVKPDLSAYQDMSKPEIYTPSQIANDITKITRYGAMEAARLRRNQRSRERYARKKAEKQQYQQQQQPK
jgi:hypothetical protein